jgi:hypothetical protein
MVSTMAAGRSGAANTGSHRKKNKDKDIAMAAGIHDSLCIASFGFANGVRRRCSFQCGGLLMVPLSCYGPLVSGQPESLAEGNALSPGTTASCL